MNLFSLPGLASFLLSDLFLTALGAESLASAPRSYHTGIMKSGQLAATCHADARGSALGQAEGREVCCKSAFLHWVIRQLSMHQICKCEFVRKAERFQVWTRDACADPLGAFILAEKTDLIWFDDFALPKFKPRPHSCYLHTLLPSHISHLDFKWIQQQ